MGIIRSNSLGVRNRMNLMFSQKAAPGVDRRSPVCATGAAGARFAFECSA